MGGGMGRLPEWDVFYPWFQNCLYGRRDAMFAGVTGPDAHSKYPPGHLVLGSDAHSKLPPRASGTRTRCPPSGSDAPLHHTSLSSSFETNL